ncbi:Response regulator receiver domain protein [compost metagenome]
MIKGFYVEDEIENITSLKRLFKLEDIDLSYKEELLDSPEGYYDLFFEQDINFVIIDKNLDKKGMGYTGLDVLKEIRKQDSNIYIVLLTSYVDEVANEDLVDFDQVIDKGFLDDQLDVLITRIKRSYNRCKSKQIVEEIEVTLQQKKDESEQHINELKKINENIEQLLRDKK